MKMNKDNTPKTFVASIRTDLRDLASLAIYLNKRSVFLETPARIASKAVETMAEMTQRECPVKTQVEAVSALRRLGYKDPLTKDARHFKALTKEIEREKREEEENETRQKNLHSHN